MATTQCGWCGVSTHVTEVFSGTVTEWSESLPENHPDVQGVFRCDECRGLLIGSYIGQEAPYFNEDTGWATPDEMKKFWKENSPSIWAPSYVEGASFPDVPSHIANAASESYKGASIGNNMSAILMARTVIEASAKEKGISKGNLLSKIDSLANQSLIRADTKEAAHAIREFGNDMAHGDISDPVSKEDAEEVLVLMSEILNELFQGPARVKAIKAKVAARKAKP